MVLTILQKECKTFEKGEGKLSLFMSFFPYLCETVDIAHSNQVVNITQSFKLSLIC